MIRAAGACALLMLGTLLALSAAPPATSKPGSAPGGPSGGSRPPLARVAWEKSRVVGAPDTVPYRSRRAFPKLSFKNPVYLIGEPGTDRLLLVEQGGRILRFRNRADADQTEVFCRIEDHDTYSIAFHPDYARNGYVYVFSNGLNSAKRRKDRIFRFQVPRTEPRRCDPKSETLVIEWESNGHNGGDMVFGNDKYLYITSGDGTSDSDGDITGQDLRDLNSGIIRIDVDHPAPGKAYAVPADNPFLKLKDARPELWAFGLRNPWRMTRDLKTGDLWVGDVGQDLWEMIHRIQRGGNYGWSVYEGSHPFYPERKLGPGPVLKPVVEHPHSEARSITGGVVYAGDKFKDLRGAYVYGDYSTGRVWAFRYEGGKVTWRKELARTRSQTVGFAQDAAGEIYLVDYGGQIQQLEPTPPEVPKWPFPRKLSETGLFRNVAKHQPDPALVPYAVNSPLWSDGAFKERFIALPGLELIEFHERGSWKFPEGTVLVKTFALEREAGNPATRQRIETRLFTLQQGEWQGYSYVWNDAQTDAELVEADGRDREFSIRDRAVEGGERRQVWHYPSRAECMVCHTRAAVYVLGVNTQQLNRSRDDLGGENQLDWMARQGVFRIGLGDHLSALDRRKKHGLQVGGYLAARLRPLVPRAALDRLRPLQGVLQKGWADYRARTTAELQKESRFQKRLPRRADEYDRLTDPYDAKADVTARARSYIHANCAHCHVWAGGGNAALELHISTPLDKTRLIDVKPLHDAFGLRDARLVAPGAPDRSVLLHRVAKTGRGRMPPLSSSEVDREAVKMLTEWVRQMKP